MEIEFTHTLSDSSFKESSDKDVIFKEFGEVEFYIVAEVEETDDSFDHAFGTEKRTGYEVTNLKVFLASKDVTSLLTEDGKSDLIDHILEHEVDYSSFE